MVGTGIITGLAYWNLDFSIKKNFRMTERISLEFQGVFADILKHNQWQDRISMPRWLCSKARPVSAL